MERFTAQELRDGGRFECELAPGKTVLMRELTPEDIALSGILSAEDVAAAPELLELSARLQQQDPEAMLAMFAAPRREQVLGLLRRYVCVAVLEPRIVLEETADPNCVPVSMLNMRQLLKIVNAKPPQRPADVNA